MERDEAIRRAEIAMAWARGKAVQFRYSSDGKWNDCPPVEQGVLPAFYDDDWRIKPKPLECWAYVESGVIDRIVQSESKPEWHPVIHSAKGHWVRMVEKQ